MTTRKKKKAPFIINPSTIGRYFFQDCDRFLRYTSTPSGIRKNLGIPQPQFDTSKVMQAIIKSGETWEVEVLDLLDQKVLIAPGKGPVAKRIFGLEETIDLVQKCQPGEYIYQATLRAPEEFYAKHEMDSDLVKFSDCRPDLISIRQEEKGKLKLRIVDIKRGESLRMTYRIQIFLYALILDSIVHQKNMTNVEVDLQFGETWLGGQKQSESFKMDTLRPMIGQFLKEELPSILNQPLDQVHWHIYHRCEWCEFFENCRQQMETLNDLSRLTDLSSRGKRHLRETAQIQDLSDLESFLKKSEADEILSQSATLVGKRPLLANQAKALNNNICIPHSAGSPFLPIGENIQIFFTFQEEPLGKTIYLAGFLVQCSEENRQKLGWSEKRFLKVSVPKKPEEFSSLRQDFILTFYKLLLEIDLHNQSRSWAEQLSLQIYVYSNQERELLVRFFLEAIKDFTIARPAMEVLLYLHGPDLMNTDNHPEKAIPIPVSVILSALMKTMALPVNSSYSLPECLSALGSSFVYQRKDYFHFPLGHGFRAEAILKAWQHGEEEQVDSLVRQATSHLYALQALLIELRKRVKDYLFAWPEKFLLPRVSTIKNTFLSRLAFFSVYESLLQCLSQRESRSTHREVLSIKGELIELICQGDSLFRIPENISVEIEESGFPSWLLVRDSFEGLMAALQFSDLMYRDKPYGCGQQDNLAVVSVPTVQNDDLGWSRTLQINFASRFRNRTITPGERFLLFPRFIDFNTKRIVSFLEKIDEDKSPSFLQLLLSPGEFDKHLPLPAKVSQEAVEIEKKLIFTPSQFEAYHRICKHRLTLVWGPPGTGKTYFLASSILALSEAHAKGKRPFRVLLTAFTHAAIENLIAKIHELRQKTSDFFTLSIAKAKEWKGKNALKGIEIVKENDLGNWIRKGEISVLGSTVWSLYKAWDSFNGFDLVVVDESSQVKVPEAALSVTSLAPNGRIIFAGDDKQLPPIVQGIYPKPLEGEPVLHRSIFEAIRSGKGGEDLVVQLQENFRMNEILTSFSSSLLYGPGYKCANKEVESRRTRLQKKAKLSEFSSYCLDPDYSMILVLLQESSGGKENEREAELVTELVCSLRKYLITPEGKAYASDKDFFQRGLFLISPHHAQIQLIRHKLREKQDWSSPPFIDTVEKMQGQEAEVVLVSYGISDPEYALQEAEFIYGLNRLNVAMTRARTKSIICLPAPLVRALPQILDLSVAEEGFSFMRGLIELSRQWGESQEFD